MATGAANTINTSGVNINSKNIRQIRTPPTKNGIVKPSGYAFRFLNRLEDYLIGKNDHCVVTTDQKNSYGIVCHNCSRLNDYYLETNEHEVSCKNMERYFEDSGELEMRFCLKDLPEG